MIGNPDLAQIKPGLDQNQRVPIPGYLAIDQHLSNEWQVMGWPAPSGPSLISDTSVPSSSWLGIDQQLANEWPEKNWPALILPVIGQVLAYKYR